MNQNTVHRMNELDGMEIGDCWLGIFGTRLGGALQCKSRFGVALMV